MKTDIKNDTETFMNQIELFMLSENANAKYNRIERALSKRDLSNNDVQWLFDYLDEVIFKKDEQFCKTIKKGTCLYRARAVDMSDCHLAKKGLRINEKGTFGYNSVNSIEPPLGLPESARNNIAGASYFYAASDEITACAEIKAGIRQVISLAEFSIKKPLHIVDLGGHKRFLRKDSNDKHMAMGKFITRLMWSYCKPVTSDDDYIPSQMISEHIRKTGVDGIRYKSFFTNGSNVTLFHRNRENIEFVQSRLLIHQFTNEVFCDFNNKSSISSINDTMTYDEDIANAMLHEIRTYLKRR